MTFTFSFQAGLQVYESLRAQIGVLVTVDMSHYKMYC